MQTHLIERDIQAIVERVVEKMGKSPRPQPPASIKPDGDIRQKTAQPASAANESRGVFEGLDSAIAAAKKAHENWISLTIAKRKVVISSMRKAALDNLRVIAEMAVSETGMGRVEDKITKNRLVAEKTPGMEILEPITFTGDDGMTLIERAPYGVIGSITPSTNPTETVINNGIGMLAGGNAVVFNPHPSAKNSTIKIIQILNEAIVKAGGPQDLLVTINEPSIATAQAMMKHEGVALLVVTGGPQVVKVAMASGKKVIAAGPGNPPVVVDETADIDKAAREIIAGASLDNNIVCIVEKEIIAVESIADELKKTLIKNGAYLANPHQVRRLENLLIEKDGDGNEVANKKFVGKDAALILKEIGVEADHSLRLIFCETTASHPFAQHEMLMPVIPLIRVKNANEGIDLARDLEHGFRHTAVMHSRNIEALSRMAKVINTSIFVKNAPSYAGLGLGGEGYTSFTIASPTGEGLTTARNFTRERRCTLAGYFRIV